MMEEFRAPVADRFILTLINNRIFGQEDFYANPKTEGVYLKRESLKRYFVEYETMLNREFLHPQQKENTTLRKCFRIQAEHLASHLQNDIPYTSFLLEI
ncbi:CRISPR-associated endonuclease Cas1 [Candidatus Kuenenia sp.]|uniref:CRISPR-associated endonuclease Cas1 n=1 Tax=Candidatus Kuenenia sp. TaxID=2499824 RepID=UPI00321FC066